jgi:hypothetical protein
LPTSAPDTILSAQLNGSTNRWRYSNEAPVFAPSSPIENRLHDLRDVTCGEDASTMRSGAAPQVMAALRSAHLALLRRAGWRNIAETHRYNAWSQGIALRLLGLTVT